MMHSYCSALQRSVNAELAAINYATNAFIIR
jgi:hypothetical protein